MKSKSNFCTHRLALVAGILMAGSVSNALSQVFTDNFNDGNDTGWDRYDTIGSHPAFPDQGTWTFPSGGYRMQAAASPAPSAVGPARIGSLRSQVYTDFYVAVDVLNWNDTIDQSFGPFARLTDIGLGTTKGYVMTYQVGSKDIDITRVTGEAAERSVRQNGEGDITLELGKSYRFVFMGKGALLTARVYDLSDLVNPLVEISGTDTEPYASGVNGLLVYDNSNTADSSADATFDNYFEADIEPPVLRMTSQSFGDWMLSWPAEASQFVLQTATAMTGNAADWTDVTDNIIPPSDGNPVYSYTFSSDPLLGGGLPKQFFRLVRR